MHNNYWSDFVLTLDSRGICFLMDFLHVRHYKNRSTGKNKKRPKTDGLYG